MNKINYSKFIEEESDDIKKLVNSIFNHPLITDHDNRKWIDYKSLLMLVMVMVELLH